MQTGAISSISLDWDDLLYPQIPASEDYVLAWLMERMATCSEQGVFSVWCDSWAEQLDEVRSFEEQGTVRSVFLQSLRTAYNFARLKLPGEVVYTEAFMLLDMEDSKQRQAPSDSEIVKQIR